MINQLRTRISDILRDPPFNKEVTVWGWVRTTRSSRALSFVHVNDGSSMESLQLIVGRDVEGVPDVSALLVGACVTASGTVVQSVGREQSCEIQVKKLQVVGASDEAYPVQKKKHTFEFLRTVPHLRTRTNTFLAVFRIRSEISYAFHEYFHDHGYAYVHPPLITRSDCEGAGQAFRVSILDCTDSQVRNGSLDYTRDYFGKPAFLSVSAQLEGEALALGMGEIYTFGPIFRADPSETKRHSAEFWMIEPEMAFYDFEDLVNTIEDFLKSVTTKVRERCAAEIEFLAESVEPGLPKRFDTILDQRFERLSYTDAIGILRENKDTFENEPVWGEDLCTEHERFLTDTVFKKLVFVTHYPRVFKPFYMYVNDDGKTVSCLDLLAPEVGELLTGSQREHRPEVLEQRVKECNIARDDYEWYIQMRRWGAAPHSGFGIGLERILMYLSGMQNIRDVLPFPRTRGSI